MRSIESRRRGDPARARGRHHRDGIRKQAARAVYRESMTPTHADEAGDLREEAVALSREIGYPCVLKVLLRTSLTRVTPAASRSGWRTKEVAQAYDAIMSSCRAEVPDAVIEGVTVQNMARPGLEVIVGMATDPQFGPVLMFGLGGVWVEVLKDVSFKIAPLTRRTTRRSAIREIRAARLLDGFRGSEPVDTAALEDILLRVSDFVSETPAGEGDGPQPHLRLPRRRHSRRCPRHPGRVTPCRHRLSSSFRTYFNAESVALVGASDKEGSFGRLFLEGLQGRRLPQDLPGQPQARGDPRHQGLPQHQRRSGASSTSPSCSPRPSRSSAW